MAKQIDIKIFTDDDVLKMKQARRTLDEVLPLIDKAESCGIECKIFKDVRNRISDQLINLEKEFMKPSQIAKSE